MRRAFTLLEVVVGLGILGLGLMVLVETQMSSLMSSVEAERMSRAQQLAHEKMMEVVFLVEVEGFTDSDKGEQGSFEDFGAEAWRGEDLGLQRDEIEGFHYAWTLRRIDLNIPTDLSGMAEQLEGTGLIPPPPEGTERPDNQNLDISAFVSSDQITEMLSAYIRELRVVVWWGSEEPDVDSPGALPEDSVELLTHVINPTGQIKSPLGSGT